MITESDKIDQIGGQARRPNFVSGVPKTTNGGFHFARFIFAIEDKIDPSMVLSLNRPPGTPQNAAIAGMCCLAQGVECLYRTCVDHSLERTSIGSIEGPSQSFNPTHVLQQNGRLSGTRSVIQADARTWSGHRLGVFLDKRLDYERSSGWLITVASGREYVHNLSASIHCKIAQTAIPPLSALWHISRLVAEAGTCVQQTLPLEALE